MPELTQAQRDVLTEQELTEHDTTRWVYVRVILVSLAKSRITSEARRKMLKKREWVRIHADRPFPVQCLECEVVWHSDGILKHDDNCTYDALAKEDTNPQPEDGA